MTIKEKTAMKELYKACKLFRKFAGEVLQQAGQLCFNVGTINEALILSGKGMKNAGELIDVE